MNIEKIFEHLDQQEEKHYPGLLAIRQEVQALHPKWSVDKAHYEAKLLWIGRNPTTVGE
jgi:hypothetical protein